MKRILIAGIGNIFLGDDAFGVEVARELARRRLPPQAEVRDFGIRGYDLAYALTTEYDAAILVDAAARGEPAGTVYLLELAHEYGSELEEGGVDGHTLDPLRVLQWAGQFGRLPERLYLVGCEPGTLEAPEGQMGLSDPVAAAVPLALEMIESLLARLLSLETRNTPGLAPV